MKFGVAIPCFCDHVPLLLQLLYSIEAQTRLPDRVVVSCSSTVGSVQTPQYSFPLTIIVTEDKKNAAQNRNIAINHLMDMDYVTFMDADDIMHPQRLEIIANVLDYTGCDIVLHHFLTDLHVFERIDHIAMRVNQLTQCMSGCIRHVDLYRYQNEHIHHAQSTVSQRVLDAVRYPEEEEYYSKEDCVFCWRVLGLDFVTNAYIANGLSFYKPSGTQVRDEKVGLSS
jgi:glycosyltransferase involved in cell wall biosynthesis